jgi:hypothetical protein
MKQNSEIILHGLVVRREVSEKGGTSIYTCKGFTKLSRGGLSEKELEKWVLTIKQNG